MVGWTKLLSAGLIFNPLYDTVAAPQLSATDNLNFVRYLGGSGPYVQNAGFGISQDIPPQCTIEQVQLLMRHGERFPGLGSGREMRDLVSRLQQYGGDFVGALSFLKNYKYYAVSEDLYEMENTRHNSPGPYIGSETCHRAGTSFRKKYSSLYNSGGVLPVFIAASKRVYDSAVYFTKGFSQGSYSKEKFRYVVITESSAQGYNSLTPRSYCPAFDYDANIPVSSQAITEYRSNIQKRLVKDHPGIDLKVDDIDNLFNLCAFEINYQGYLKFCDIFTQDEFISHGYQSDLGYYYSSGPGGKLTREIGSIQLRASLKLLKEDNPNKIWLSFTHDTDIEMFHSALGLFDTIRPLPADRVEVRDVYRHTDVVPMGGRTVIEKYSCDDGNEYVRFLVNDAVIPISSCSNGPGFACKLSDFESYVEERLEDVKIENCDNDGKSPNELTFYWDYKEHIYNDEPIKINP